MRMLEYELYSRGIINCNRLIFAVEVNTARYGRANIGYSCAKVRSITSVLSVRIVLRLSLPFPSNINNTE